MNFSDFEEKVIEWRNKVLGIKPIEYNYDSKIPLYSPFKLPISYLPPDKQHTINDMVLQDIELEARVYNNLLRPQTNFGELMIQEWKKSYTSDIEFLEETQNVIKSMGCFNDLIDPGCCTNVLSIWKRAKQTNNFLEHYCYMDWDVLLFMNKSPFFLQCLSIANLMSPIASFIMPIFLLLIPFLILKIQGIPITFELYLGVLKDIAKSHFIGKALTNIENVSVDKVIYLVFSIALYFLQVYQNFNICNRFYKNIHQINDDLTDMKNMLSNTITSMKLFYQLHHDKLTYREFCNDILNHSLVLETFKEKLESVSPMSYTLTKFTEIGSLLEIYYAFYCNVEYERSIRYAMGFEGYLENLRNVHSTIVNNMGLNFAKFTTEDGEDILEEQIYPLLDNNSVGHESSNETMDVVSNTCKLNKNIILTGPNASGKTTLLKTTMINVILTQQLGCGYYKSCCLNPYTHMHSYLNIPDTSQRDSLFQAEARRCKDILDIINDDYTKSKHLCIFDELYSGTNPIEASKAAFAFLVYLSKYRNVQFLLTTHYVSICNKVRKEVRRIETSRQLRCMKMNVRIMPDNKFVYTYHMIPGISKLQGAKVVLKNMEYPKEILDLCKFV